MPDSLKRRLKNGLKRGMRGAFEIGQRLGWDLLPRHFYSEIPDIRRLRRSAGWKRPFPMEGVQGADLAGQEAFLRTIVPPPLVDRVAAGDIHARACQRNGEPGFGPIEAECLFAFVHTLRPPRIVQVGCGVSTAICLQAAGEAGYRPEIVCIEPYPSAFLTAADAAGEIRLVRRPVEDLVAAEALADLRADDLFFVDSTHCLGPAGEVTRLVLEFLPLLPAGAHAHFHDIYFPYDYSPDVLDGGLFFHHESPLLHAFLHGNRRFRLSLAMSDLHHRAPRALAAVFRNYTPAGRDEGLTVGKGHFPSSAYVMATA